MRSSKVHKPRRRRILLAMGQGDLAIERRRGIAEYARDAGWILESRFFAFLVHGQHLDYMKSVKIDGIISMIHPSETEIYKAVAAATVPVVDLWHDFPELKVPRVLLDHQATGRIGADHLLNLGLRHLVYYSHMVDRRVAKIRCEGFRERARSRGVEVEEIWWDRNTPNPSGLGRIEWLAGKLKRLPHPLGVMAVNDAVALEVVDAADLADLRVPEDVAILGTDNDPIMSELGAVTLSSVDLARPRLGYEAAALLDRLMRGEQPPTEPILIAPAGVVTRRSTEVIAVSDPDINQAARYIHEHFREPITVSDVAAHTPLSRRLLQDRFRAALGHGMNEEITRQRVQFCKHLLTHTTHKISAIATLSGFGRMQRLNSAFRRETGMTPQTYRQKYQPTIRPRE